MDSGMRKAKATKATTKARRHGGGTKGGEGTGLNPNSGFFFVNLRGFVPSWLPLGLVLVVVMTAACEEKKSGPQVVGPAPKAMPPVAPRQEASADVFPSGQETPEGVACDLARAFMNLDGELLRKVCFAITPGSPERDAYNDYIDAMVTAMDVAKGGGEVKFNRPASVGTVFKARVLTSAGPTKYGAEELRLTNVMFVDVRVTLRQGSDEVRRTLVVRDEGSGLWYAVPRSEYFPRLSEGLCGETQSAEVWKK